MNLDDQIRQAEENLRRLKEEKARQEAEAERLRNLPPDKRLAECLHRRLCYNTLSVMDICRWEYEESTWLEYEHATWLKRAKKILDLGISVETAMRFLDIAFGLEG